MTLTAPKPDNHSGTEAKSTSATQHRDYSSLPDVTTHDRTSFPYILSKNVSVPVSGLATGPGLIRCNIYRPHDSDTNPVPVLVTYGPYGKDISYSEFNPKSFSEVNPAHKSVHSCWETPDPSFWTAHSYALLRADELGTGQSPGFLDTMSRSTSEAFAILITWASSQPWSTGKVGLLGVSYYAGSQWRVAARQPTGLAAIIPWEGMSDYYRDRCRHGGIYSDGFVRWWWERQVVGNQYGLANRRGGKTVDENGEKEKGELERERRDQTVDNRENRYRDEGYYREKEYDMGDITVPVLSVGNWGGILLHLRGNIQGYLHAGSEKKFLRMITGRHDLPFYYDEEVEVQRSFLDAFLKGEDGGGWTDGRRARVDLVIRKGDAGVNDAQRERDTFERREEEEWPIERTEYARFYLSGDMAMTRMDNWVHEGGQKKLGYRALGTIDESQGLTFKTVPSDMGPGQEMEITGHIVAHLNVSVSPDVGGPTPSDIDLFLTLRHIGKDGKEIFYTGTAGDPVPLTKGWLRVSLRKVNEKHPKHQPWLPHRDYTSRDVLPVIQGEVYAVDVEMWPTCVVLQEGESLALEVASGDTQGSGIFLHNDAVDRSPDIFQGTNYVHISKQYANYLLLPVIPRKEDVGHV
ncbi:hypothetical protein QC761_403420 [Podospora bellae-mahoneyi]|uniref:Xaa-Pro dipeptidyl-peptidase C-terminal domain-containing protein n=1 Tax=Podospora bellae-mahoneyi TaxID=2093777 RepID=A0ABR0FHS9_9PEZI|nr:hypothetical protein QC761_403420 [Podospora bellae-mahoneyi]